MRATIHVLRQVDVGDSVDVEKVAKILESREPKRGTTILAAPIARPPQASCFAASRST